MLSNFLTLSVFRVFYQPFCSKFKDWTAVLQRFRSAVNSWQQNPVNASNFALAPGGRPSNSMQTRVNLVLSLARNARQEDAGALSTNFIAAALHLHYLLNEPKLGGNKLPDLPDGKLGRELVKQWWYAILVLLELNRSRARWVVSRICQSNRH